ncbi:unnamed protein product [Urochloa decumbens]|uniref:Uncharacterized protein n=1 Tax=Urochloa decumbens TaxID=240449 RepID=A0ABC9AA15_9POAL
MDFPKRERALPQGSPGRTPKAMRPGTATEADENASPKRPVPAGAASLQRKKVLGERNDGAGMEVAKSPPPQQPKPAPSPPTLTGRGAGPYDPKTNYTTPRPEFLRYDPERRREILLRVARAAEVEDDDCSSSASATAASEDDGGSAASDDAAAASPVSSAQRSDSEAELEDSDDDGEEEEEVAQPRRGRWARRLFLLLIAVACSICYMHSMNPATFPVPSEDGVDFIGPIGGMYNAGDHEVDSLSLLGPFYMMGPEDVLEETTKEFVHGESEDVVHLHDHRASSKNLVAVSMMGLSDICLKVPLGELTCQLGDGSSDNRTADMEEGREEGEDNSNEFVMQFVSMESHHTAVRRSLETEELNLGSELWDYENTAEAAKALCYTVKFIWSALEHHFLHILACLSVAGFVAGMSRYFQRSSSKSLAEVPLLIPHQTAQLSVPPSPQAVQLSVYPSEQPKQLTVPKQRLSGSLPLPNLDPLVSLKDRVQEPLPKTDTSVSLKVPVHHGDDNSMKASNDNFLNQRNVDSSKPPVVELLGEFTFAESSRGRTIKSLNQYGGDVAVQELTKKDVDKIQMNSSIIQTPNVRRERKEESSAKGEKMDAAPVPLTPTPLTPTPLRRSSRLRNKVTSP